MDNREQVREFLTSRRAKIDPERAGLPSGSRRRVPGLRRSEVAALADVSVEYYAKLERGNLAGVSPSVLEALPRSPAGRRRTCSPAAPGPGTAEPGSPSEEGLRLLASWAAGPSPAPHTGTGGLREGRR